MSDDSFLLLFFLNVCSFLWPSHPGSLLSLHPRSDVGWDSREDMLGGRGKGDTHFNKIGWITFRAESIELSIGWERRAFYDIQVLFAWQCIDCPILLLLMDYGVWCCAVVLFGVQVFLCLQEGVARYQGLFGFWLLIR